MAVRSATRRYADILGFLSDWEETLRAGGLLLPAGTIDGEPAPDMRIDVLLPPNQRIGPISAQVVTRMQDGGVAVHIRDIPAEILAAVRDKRAEVDKVREWLLAKGEVGPKGGADPVELATVKKRVLELEQALQRSEALRASGAPVSAAAQGRGFPVPETGTLAATDQGNLGDTKLRDLLMRLAVEKASGLLTVKYPDGRTRWGFWLKGGAVGWRTEPLDEQEVLGILLFRANQITKEQLAQSVEIMQKRGCRQGEALIEMGVLTFAQLVLLLQKQAEFILQRVLVDKQGTWTYHPMDEFPERFVTPPVRVAAILYRMLRQRAKELPADELSTELRPLLDKYLFVRAGVEKTLEEMRLSAEEQGFIRILTATSYRLRELPAVSNISRSLTAAIVWTLRELGLIEFRDEEARARVSERVGKSLQSRKVVLDRGTLFDRLDLHWICTSVEVEAAWARIEEEFPANDLGRYGVEWQATATAIRNGCKEAYDRLRMEASRREYRASVIEKTMIEQSAIILAQKGDMAMVKEQAREAWECYSKANELVPGRDEFRAGLARAEMVGGSRAKR